MRIVLSIKQIQYNNPISFWGNAYFYKANGSSIIIGKGCSFRSDKTSNLIGNNRKCIISTHTAHATIFIGDNSGFTGTVIGAKKSIKIGNNVLCGANTLITDFDWHDIDPAKRLTSTGDAKEVVIGNNVFIGYGAIVLKGVNIGDNSVIGANSLVTGNIPANCVAAGNPAKFLKFLDNGN